MLTELHGLCASKQKPRVIEGVPTLTIEEIFENLSRGMIGFLKKLEPAENMKYYFDLLLFMIVRVSFEDIYVAEIEFARYARKIAR